MDRILKEYNFSYDSLQMEASKVYEMLRLDPLTAPEPYPSIIADEIDKLKNNFQIRGGYVIVGQVEVLPEAVRLEKVLFGTGKNLSVYLKKAEKAALFVCTAGEYVGIRSRKLMADGLLVEGFVCDVIGTVVVETAMDKIHGLLTKEMEGYGLGVSNRYSPGYCNWNVNEQHKLFSFLPEKFCGVSLTETALMQPIKTVSGIIGIGKNIKKIPYLCETCTSKDCIYRNIK